MHRNIMHGREHIAHVIEDFMSQSAKQDTSGTRGPLSADVLLSITIQAGFRKLGIQVCEGE